MEGGSPAGIGQPLPVGELDGRLDELAHNHPVVVHCQTGAGAATAASLLRARGLREVSQYPGGFAEWRAAGLPVEIS